MIQLEQASLLIRCSKCLTLHTVPISQGKPVKPTLRLVVNNP